MRESRYLQVVYSFIDMRKNILMILSTVLLSLFCSFTYGAGLTVKNSTENDIYLNGGISTGDNVKYYPIWEQHELSPGDSVGGEIAFMGMGGRGKPGGMQSYAVITNQTYPPISGNNILYITEAAGYDCISLEQSLQPNEQFMNVQFGGGYFCILAFPMNGYSGSFNLTSVGGVPNNFEVTLN
jgi:hypothetical protein